MKSNRITWGFVSLLVLITITFSSSQFIGSGQERTLSKTKAESTPVPDTRNLSKYASVDLAAAESALAPDQDRFLANQRYDKLEWVYKSVESNPDAASVGRITDAPPPPLFPIAESDLVIVGRVSGAKGFLSNDRGGIYTEFTINIEEVLKSSEKKRSEEVVADREGGVVIYPNGQRVLYQNSNVSLPELGSTYIFFLSKNGGSPNYQIQTSYDVTSSKVRPMEVNKAAYKEFKDLDKVRFLETVRNKIVSFSND